MKKLVCVAAVVLAAACASTQNEPDLPPLAAPAAAPDPRVGELQTQLTELLERIDVLNHRIAQLEEGGAAAAPAAVAAPAPAAVPQPTPAPRATPVAEAATAPQ